jgi:hypothetical protein
MVAAARWIAQLSTPHLLKALKDFPTYIIKVGLGVSSLYHAVFLSVQVNECWP